MVFKLELSDCFDRKKQVFCLVRFFFLRSLSPHNHPSIARF